MKRFLWILPLGAMMALIAQQPVLVRQNGNTAAVTAAGALKTDGSAVTQPVSGTVTANQGGAPWSVTVSTFPDNEPFNLAQYNGVAVGAGNAIHVQPGTGAIFAASQSGNWTSRVVGNAGATMDATVGAATAPTNGLLTLGVYNSTEPSPTTGQSVGIQLDSKGRQRQVIMDAAGNTRGANVNASNQLSVSIDGSTATNISTNIAQMNGVAVTMGNGVSGTGVQRVTIASDSTGTVAATQSGTWSDRVVGNAGGAFDAANNGAVPANILAMGFEEATQGTTQPTAGTAGNLRRAVISTDGALYTRFGGPVNFTCSADNIANTLTQLTGCAGAGAGLKYYITDVVASSTTSTGGQWILRTGTGTNCGTGTASILPSAATAARFSAPANTSASTAISFNTPIVTAANVQVCVLGVATNTTTIQINGYIAP